MRRSRPMLLAFEKHVYLCFRSARRRPDKPLWFYADVARTRGLIILQSGDEGCLGIRFDQAMRFWEIEKFQYLRVLDGVRSFMRLQAFVRQCNDNFLGCQGF
jgi:hypothetical protein